MRTVPMPPAPSCCRMRYFGSDNVEPPPGLRPRIAEPPGGVKAEDADAILAAVRLLALDVGDVRIGVALSDETGTLASGLVTLKAAGPRKDAQAVASLVREHGAGEVVVGLPLRLDGSVGPQAEKVLAFVERLRRVLRVPVVTRDERLTVGRGRRAARRGGGEAPGSQGPHRPGGGRAHPPGASRRAESRGVAGGRRDGRVKVKPSPRARPRAGRRLSRRVASLALALVAVAGLAGLAWAAWWHETAGPKIAEGAPAVRLVVPPGASAETIARQLAELGLVRHPLVFRALARRAGAGRPAQGRRVRARRAALPRGDPRHARAGRRRAPRPDRPGGEGPRRDRRPRGGGGARPGGVPRGRARPLAGARSRPRGHRPRGLPLPRHLRPSPVARRRRGLSCAG